MPAPYSSSRYAYEGTETTETSITRVGGATDPTSQAQSRKIVTSANSQWLRPFKAEPYAIWNPTSGANVTVTVCGTVNAGALPNNDDIWLECEYLTLSTTNLFTQFNPADLNNVTLSNGNLTAAGTGVGSGVRTVNSLSSGKYYLEYTFTTVNTNGFSVGVALASYSFPSSGVGGAYVARLSGSITINGSYTGVDLGTINTGNIIGVAIDVTAALIWFRLAPSGNWNNSGTANPATGVGGFSISVLSGALYGLMGGANGDICTANFGASSFSGAVPSGFTSGVPIGTASAPLGTIVTTTKANVLAAGAAVASDSSSWNSLPHTTFDGVPSAGIVMSNGNLTVTHGTTGNGTGVSSTALLSGGKYYFECTLTVAPTVTAETVGINSAGNPIINMANGGGIGCTTINLGVSHAYVNSNSLTQLKDLGAYTVGTVIGVAIDLTNRLAWFRLGAGNWNADGTANPSTGVGGVTIGVGSFAPAVAFTNTSATDSFTANFGATSFANAAPSGFLSWDTGWTSFKLTTTLSAPQPGLAGYLEARVRAAKPSTTYYVDPKITLS